MAATVKTAGDFSVNDSTVVMKRQTQPVLVSRPQSNRKPRRMNTTHVALLATFILLLACQLMVAHTQLVNLHYEIEGIEYQSGKLETEKNAYYQHQAELSKLSRLKEAVANDGAALDASKVFRLTE